MDKHSFPNGKRLVRDALKHDDNLHYEKFADGSVKCVEDEIPFELPEGWEWTRLGCIGNWQSGATPSRRHPEYYGGSIPWLKTGDLNDGFINSVSEYITEEGINNSSAVLNPVGSVLIAMYGATIGKLGIANIEVTTNQACCACLPILIINQYLFYFLMYQKKYFIEKAVGGAQPNISKKKIVATLFPVPPFREQKKIVSTVNNLLSKIDSIVKNKNEITNTIITTKSKILDLAIRGKLVPQDPNDEPASALLERIQSKKEELIKQGKIKRNKKESVIFKGSDNSYYLRTGELEESLENWRFNDLPETWEICCLGELCNYGDCINVNTEDITENAWILDLEDIEKDTGTVLKKVTKAQRNSVSTKHKFHSGQVLYSKLRPYLNKVVLSDDDGYCTSEILPLEFKNCVLPEYARYYLMSGTFIAYANHCSYGVKMPRLGTTDGKKAIFSLPPLSEQKRIVKTIDSYFMQLNRISEALT